MTYFTDSNFSSSDLAGYVATLVLQDQKSNQLGFGGFPQITVEQHPDGFHCYFDYQGRRAGPLVIPAQDAKQRVKAYEQGAAVNTAEVKTVQPFMAMLESASPTELPFEAEGVNTNGR
ncbi:hypothetical protein [Parahaliea mediterranea]|uniref:hypothetical protein n=1 Tax=Parahaliea mediterranea TaxID=651086 RepID=UPI000E2FCE61|nr:hypothetical protein [Parahaliea mediterranea]